jgi:hypothetical protein
MKPFKLLTIIIILMMIQSKVTGQRDHRVWTVGMTYQPFLYWAYNKGESQYMPDQYPIKPGKFNGKALGVWLGYKLSDNIDLNVELTYSAQVQKYKYSSSWRQLDSVNKEYYFGDDVINTYEIIKMPIKIGFKQEIVYDSGVKIGLYMGPQLSYLMKYSLEYFQHPKVDIYKPGTNQKIGFYFDQDSVINYIIREKYKSYQEFTGYFSDTTIIRRVKQSKAFRDFTVGVVGGIAISKEFFDVISIRIGSRVEYDLTRMEIGRNRPVSLTYYNNNPLKERPYTHQVRFGLTLSVGYRF